MNKFLDDIRDSIKTDVKDSEVPGRFDGVESFFSNGIGGGSVSWGLVVLMVAAVYAIYNLVVVILNFFG